VVLGVDAASSVALRQAQGDAFSLEFAPHNSVSLSLSKAGQRWRKRLSIKQKSRSSRKFGQDRLPAAFIRA